MIHTDVLHFGSGNHSFGEGAPLVKTADNVDTPANRRVQYIVSTFTPHIAGPGSWQRVQ